jgi:hypothetical protein
MKLTTNPHLNAEVKKGVELYLHSPNMPSWRGAELKHRSNFTFIGTALPLTLSGGSGSRITDRGLNSIVII